MGKKIAEQQREITFLFDRDCRLYKKGMNSLEMELRKLMGKMEKNDTTNKQKCICATSSSRELAIGTMEEEESKGPKFNYT
jgi:phosphoenolpyruvate synthase/pyruvate phosphate dikinase